jgi:hypothetical protein
MKLVECARNWAVLKERTTWSIGRLVQRQTRFRLSSDTDRWYDLWSLVQQFANMNRPAVPGYLGARTLCWRGPWLNRFYAFIYLFIAVLLKVLIFFCYFLLPYWSNTWLYLWDFRFLTASSMKMVVFWDTAPCSLVAADWSFRGAYCLYHLNHRSTPTLHSAVSQKTTIFMTTICIYTVVSLHYI